MNTKNTQMEEIPNQEEALWFLKKHQEKQPINYSHKD